jgi:Tol biopolymer transport system component
LSAFPSWSPDGRYLVFTAGWIAGQPSLGTGGSLELTALDVAQALADPAQVQPIRVTHWVGDDLSPAWQPK